LANKGGIVVGWGEVVDQDGLDATPEYVLDTDTVSYARYAVSAGSQRMRRPWVECSA